MARTFAPPFDSARRKRIDDLIRAMLRRAKQDPDRAPAIVAELEQYAVAFAHQPGESYVGPFRLFNDVKRAADALRDELVTLIRQHAAEMSEWDYSTFLLKRRTLNEGDGMTVANRLHSVLSLGHGRSLQVSVEDQRTFLSTLPGVGCAPSPNSGATRDLCWPS